MKLMVSATIGDDSGKEWQLSSVRLLLVNDSGRVALLEEVRHGVEFKEPHAQSRQFSVREQWQQFLQAARTWEDSLLLVTEVYPDTQDALDCAGLSV
jgi:hypothetical protein